jgi:indolepyruvate ferredoxin oxidoreductase alpha subunit
VKELLYGNEAIARGARDAGCAVATGYPGTPSTEIIESMAQFRDVHVEWSTNEKVALEVAIGASISGRRAMSTMKMVGLNVASDPLMTVSYMGVRGGLVIVTADDPGMHSSQNEQDNRWYGKFAKVPVLEPSDSAEAYTFTRAAFDLSEEYDTAVILRSTTRISHARSLVEPGERLVAPAVPYEKAVGKYVMLPGNARKRKPLVLERLGKLAQHADKSLLNRVEWGNDASIGFITGGVSYQYVKEAFPDVPVLKLGIAYPLPADLILDFVAKVGRLFVVEELDPFWETEIRAMGIECWGKDVFPEIGELSPQAVREGVARALNDAVPAQEVLAEPVSLVPPTASLPERPPVLCPGCPHRGVYYVLKKLSLTVAGDIGCYTLGALPPLSSLDTTTCMGASIGHAQGMRLGLPPDKACKVVAVIGDSTFLHSGITPLLNMTYNRVDAPVLILDNGTTAMTGHQGHPASGLNARHEEAPKVSIEGIAKACGRERVTVVGAYDLAAMEAAVRDALDNPSSVIVARAPCVLITRERKPAPMLRADLCIECGLCMRAGCPALERSGKKPVINATLCIGCGVCASICPKEALVVAAPPEPAVGPEPSGSSQRRGDAR